MPLKWIKDKNGRKLLIDTDAINPRTGEQLWDDQPLKSLKVEPSLIPLASSDKIKSLIKSLEIALQAGYSIPSDASPIAPIIDALIDIMLELTLLISRGNPIEPNTPLEAGLVDDPNFSSISSEKKGMSWTGAPKVKAGQVVGSTSLGYFSKNTEKTQISATMPRKLMKIWLPKTYIPKNRIFDFNLIIQWLKGLRDGFDSPLSKFFLGTASKKTVDQHRRAYDKWKQGHKIPARQLAQQKAAKQMHYYRRTRPDTKIRGHKL